jgi:hypothetical protein
MWGGGGRRVIAAAMPIIGPYRKLRPVGISSGLRCGENLRHLDSPERRWCEGGSGPRVVGPFSAAKVRLPTIQPELAAGGSPQLIPLHLNNEEGVTGFTPTDPIMGIST